MNVRHKTKARTLPPKRAGARLRRTRLAVSQPYSVHQSSSSSLPLAACLVFVAAGEPPLVGRCCAAAAAGETWVAWWLADWAGCTAVGGAEPPLPLRGALAGAAGAAEAAGATWVGGAAGADSAAMACLAGGACIDAAS